MTNAADNSANTLEKYIGLFRFNGKNATLNGSELRFGEDSFPVTNGIPRFVKSGETYSEGNFSRLRTHHATLQLDSQNGTTDRHDTILRRTNWSPTRLHGKTVLECGCGVGPDTEVLLSLGANVVAADLAGLDITQQNLGKRDDLCLIQADIANLPLKSKSFDVIFCHRVLQHTPDPEKTLNHILQFLKPGGGVFVHTYARSSKQMLNWKYALRPFTKAMPPQKLYSLIQSSAPLLYAISRQLCRTNFGRKLQYVLVPFRYYGHRPEYSSLNRSQILEYGVHDTFDALSPKHDHPLSSQSMRAIASKYIDKDFEIINVGTVTLLRTT